MIGQGNPKSNTLVKPMVMHCRKMQMRLAKLVFLFVQRPMQIREEGEGLAERRSCWMQDDVDYHQLQPT